MRDIGAASIHRFMGRYNIDGQYWPNNRKKRNKRGKFSRMRYIRVFTKKAMDVINGKKSNARTLVDSYGKPKYGVFKYIPSR